MNGDQDRALEFLLRHLKREGYRFTTPTPATHARVIARRSEARDLRDVFGWSLPFAAEVVGVYALTLLNDAGMLDTRGALFASRVRVSTLDDDTFLHSAYPITQQDAVFFGPDSYRFADFIRAELAHPPRTHIVDLGAGAGVGGIVASRVTPNAFVTLTDINIHAVRLSAINWVAADLGAVSFMVGAGLDHIDDAERPIDCIIANPPYIADTAHRAYRDGGGLYGGEASIAWARAAAARLRRGGAFLLYTGTAVVGGDHVIEAPLRDALAGFDLSFREIDPDVFGEELEREDYAGVERIAVVGVVAVKR